MGRGAEGPHASLAYRCLDAPPSPEALCYPPGRRCDTLVYEAERAGLYRVCGPLGKGHSSIVVLAYTRWGLAAVKVRRADSRRDSLWDEAKALERASRAGASPRPFYYSRDLIVMEAVLGPTLGEAVEGAMNSCRAVLEALRASRALDSAGILHLELHRPWRNVLFSASGKALIVDLDSHREGCGNVPRLLSGLTGRLRGLRRVIGEARGLLRAYYEGGCPEEVYADLAKKVSDVLCSDTGP